MGKTTSYDEEEDSANVLAAVGVQRTRGRGNRRDEANF